MTYTTKTPRLFAKYFCEQESRKLAKDLELFEKCHGEAASVEVIFFIENGLINRMATPSDTTYGNVLGYNFSDYAVNKYNTKRQLLVRVSPATL